VNQIRGLPAECGIFLPLYVGRLRRGLPSILEDAENDLPGFGRRLFHSLYQEPTELEQKVQAADQQIQIVFQANEDCRESQPLKA